MKRGTTPTLVLKIPYDAAEVQRGYVTISQNNGIKLDLPLTDERIRLQDGRICVSLRQKDTLLLSSNTSAALQVRLVLRGETAVASNILLLDVGKILKEGVI